jgi:hypothetical protein
MSVLSDYTTEEQALLMQGPRLGAIVISAASPGRASETAAEGFAAIDYAMRQHREFIGNTLIASILFELDQLEKAEFKFKDYGKLAVAEDAGKAALAQLGQIADALDAKSNPAEAATYKQWVLNAASASAEAGKEGGNFFGRGAVLVNDAERAALAEIARTLRAPGSEGQA